MHVATPAKGNSTASRVTSLVKLECYAEAPLPTHRGTFRALVFREVKTGTEHVAMVLGDLQAPQAPEGALVRVHSECLTGEVLGSLKCDCRDQLDDALDQIAAKKSGVLVYLRQEGRGIGLGNKIRAYALQAAGADTYEANRRLGFADDLRRYDLAGEILRYLGVRKIDLITNNPQKVAALAAEGIEVAQRVPSLGHVNPHNRHYLETKRSHTGHLIELDGLDEQEG